jgi:cytoskeleton protein RodZ
MASPKRKNSQQEALAHRSEPQSAEIVAMPFAQKQNPEPEPAQPLEHIGDILRRERERRGDDLQHIADYLRIGKRYLVAIEDSKYDEFPADIYVIGFLRSYAQYLDLNGQDVIDYYRHEMEGRRKKPALVVRKPIGEGKAPSATILAGAAILALLIYGAWYSFSSSDRASVNLSPALPTAATSDAATDKPLAAAAPTPAPALPPATVLPDTVVIPPPAAPAQPAATSVPEQVTPEAAPPAQPSRITIKAEEASWVQVSDAKGHAVFDNILKPGETYSVPDEPGMTLTTGNGAGIVIILDGKKLPKLTTSASKMLRDISLNATALKKAPTAK